MVKSYVGVPAGELVPHPTGILDPPLVLLIVPLRCTHTERQRQRQGPLECIVPLENQSPLHFQAAQCIPMDLAAAAPATAAAAAAARCAHALSGGTNNTTVNVREARVFGQPVGSQNIEVYC